MDRKTLRPAWQPSLAPGREWTLEHLRKYLGGRSFTLYAHGSCVVWIGAGEFNVAEANQRLRAVTLQHPDFRVQRHTDGNYLVTFKGGVGGLMSGEFLATHWASSWRLTGQVYARKPEPWEYCLPRNCLSIGTMTRKS